MPRNREITAAIEEICPLSLQESWDNSGWQCGDPDAECSGVLICVDVTEQILDEALERGCNLVVAHHPLLFSATRSIIIGDDRVNRCVAKALRSGISIYSSHTACDCAPEGVSHEMGLMLGLSDIEPLDPATGLGVVGTLRPALPWREFLDKVKEAFGTHTLRYSQPPSEGMTVSKVALCGGSAAEFLPQAAERGAQVYVTADCKHNTFLDVGRRPIMLVDAGHYETEYCTKEIFNRAITEKFPNFAVLKSSTERNPVNFY